MPGVMDIIVRAQDEASAVFEQIGSSGEEAGGLIQQHWLTATAALATAGAGLEGLARSQQDATIKAGQLARRLGESEDTVRGWASETSNAGFALDEVVDLMEIAAKRGLEGQQTLQTYASFWDDVADASGESAVALGEAGVGLAGIGIAAGEEAEALDALGFVMDNTTAGTSEFLTFIGRMGPELREMNVDINDAAAILATLENELGLSGRTARSEFRSAVSESDGTLQGMLATLGVSQEQFATWRGQVEGSGAAIEENAAIADAALTPLQQLQTALGDLAYGFGPVINQAADLAPLLIAAGPAARGAQLAFQGLQAIAPAVGAAMHLMLGPIGLVTGALAALAAAFAVDLFGMRTAAEGAVDDMAMNFGDMGDTVHRLADEAGVSFQEMKDRIKAEMEETGRSFETVTETIDRELSGMPITAEAHFENFTAVTHQHLLAAKGVVETETAAMAEELGSLPEQGADALLANQFVLTDATTELVNFMDEALSPAAEMWEARAFLASRAYRDAIESDNPLVRQKAEEMREEAEAVLARTSEFYGGGRSAGIAWGNGLRSAEDWARLMAWELAASTDPILHGKSPPPEGPLSDIDVGGYNVGRAWAEGLAGAAPDARSSADALAGAAAAALSQGPSGAGIPVTGTGVPGLDELGVSAGEIRVYQLIVDGAPKTVGTRDEILDAWETIEAAAVGGR